MRPVRCRGELPLDLGQPHRPEPRPRPTTLRARAVLKMPRGEHLAAWNKAHATHGSYMGGRESSTHAIWRGMIQRCRNPRSKDFESYGGRGISVCDRWLDFSVFIADMGQRPPGM